MSVTVVLPPSLQTLAGGLKNVETGGQTVKDCLAELAVKYPQLKGKFYNRKGQLNKGMNLFINGTIAYPGELSKTVKDGDKIHLAYTVLGG